MNAAMTNHATFWSSHVSGSIAVTSVIRRTAEPSLRSAGGK